MPRCVYTTVELNMETGEVMREEYYDYSGPWEECKRDTAKAIANQQMQLQNQLAQQQLAYQHQLAGMVQPYIQQILGMQSGFFPQQLAAMRTQATQGTAQDYMNALRGTKTALATRGVMGGGAIPAGGLMGQGFGQLLSQQAQQQSGLQSNINIQDAQQRLANILNSGNLLGGLAGIFNPAPFVGGASSALGTYGNLWTAPTILNNMLSGASQGLAQGMGGGLASMMSKAKPVGG